MLKNPSDNDEDEGSLESTCRKETTNARHQFRCSALVAAIGTLHLGKIHGGKIFGVKIHGGNKPTDDHDDDKVTSRVESDSDNEK